MIKYKANLGFMVQLTWYQLVLVVGFIQALILIFLLLLKPENRKSNLLLAALLFVIGRGDISELLPGVNLARDYPFLLPVFYEYLFVLGPILYFYVRSLTQSTFRFNRVFWIYIGLALSLDIAYDYTLYWCRMTKFCSRAWIITFAEIFSLLSVMQMGVVLVLSVRTLRQYDRSLKDHFTNLEKINLRWLQNLLKAIGALAIYWIILVWVDILFFDYRINDIYYNALNVAVVITVYWIGFSQYIRPRVVIVEEIEVVPKISDEAPKVASPSPLAEDEMQQYAQMLQKAMQQDQLYLDATLNLNALAKHLDIPAKHISHTLNQHVGKNLNDFVNEFRIEEVKQKLIDPKFAHLTILGIAFEAGFNSKASFQRTFKKLVQCSPSEYKKQRAKAS
ncbi:hypothetical protein BKI52_29390 [marine bacterium AO1-C]|nr:hypothetical protein BKI52_29390 [marine bacterium AO1-C]